MKLVYVEWLDSYGVGVSWTTVEKIKTPDLLCKSVGWLIQETETMICVAPHITQDDHDVASYAACGEMHIPRVSIVQLVELNIWKEGVPPNATSANLMPEEPSRQLSPDSGKITPFEPAPWVPWMIWSSKNG